MFTSFFYYLRERKVPVSITEWMTLMECLSRGMVHNLDDFYFMARAILVKSEAHFDHYDVAFQAYFQGVETPAEIAEKILDWVRDPLIRRMLSEEEIAKLNTLDFDELLKQFEEPLKEQTERHDGGNHWIGRGGTSPFGHSGFNLAGIRVGGESWGRHAVKIAGDRLYRNYRDDLTLDVRQTKMALKRLRELTRTGAEEELDIDQTIDATAKNLGDIELKWRKLRKNSVKVLLLMDAGGTMEPYAALCSLLFSAAKASTHFKDLQYYYFHNCVYDNLYRDIERRDAVSTEQLLQTLEADYKVIFVGDARMSPYELLERHGAISDNENNEIPGINWLKRFSEHFKHAVWLNPEERRFWMHPTVRIIGRLFPMYQLTLDGLGVAVKKLVVKR